MRKEPVLVAGTANPSLAKRLGELTGHAVAETDIRRFPDGEVFVRVLDDLAGAPAHIIQGTHPNEAFVELLLLQDAVREAGAGSVTTVIPYFGYARQDRAFHPGEAVSSRALARAINATANHVITVDPHKEDILRFFDGSAESISAVPELAATLGSWGVDCILAPDKGAQDRAQVAADVLGVPSDHLEKTRLSATEVRMQAKALDVDGLRVAIVDDMIASGGTMVTAAAQLKQQGAKRVYAACTHGLFTNGAVKRLLEGGIDRVLATDSIETAGCDVVSAAPIVASALGNT